MLLPKIHIKEGQAEGKISDPIALLKDIRIAGSVFIDLDEGKNPSLLKDMIKISPGGHIAGISNVDLAVELLNLSAQTIVVEMEEIEKMIEKIPPERITIRYTGNEEEKVQRLLSLSSTLPSIFSLSNLDVLKLIHKAKPKNSPATFLFEGEAKEEEIIHLIKDGISCCVPPSKSQFAQLFAACLKSDREDKLIPTVVIDQDRKLIGQVYSSNESIKEAITTSTGVYWSRSRGKLWRKGETSGATQTLLQVGWDCDHDSLFFKVKQEGPGFCHLERFSCFGVNNGISKVAKTIECRKNEAPTGSYTKRLFTEPGLLNAKILEEAKELMDAKTKDEAAWECADLIYFALVKAIGLGASLRDVEDELDRRSFKITRRKGDAKPHILQQIQEQKTESETKS